jgi:hypothetical protein
VTELVAEEVSVREFEVVFDTVPKRLAEPV